MSEQRPGPELRGDDFVRECKSCGAKIVWANITKKDGSPGKMPFDADPNTKGTHRIVMRVGKDPGTGHERKELHASWVERGDRPTFVTDGGKLRTSHFATCPNADQHRRGKA